MTSQLDNLESLLELKLNRQQMTQNCEVAERPARLMTLDAGAGLYRAFCDVWPTQIINQRGTENE